VHEPGRPLGAWLSTLQASIGGAVRDEALRRELLVGVDQEVARQEWWLMTWRDDPWR